MAITLYGIKNCDSVKKARRFLDDSGVTYHFHDYRVDGVDKKQVSDWVVQHGWETVLNKRGTTWRQLSDKTKSSTTADNVVDLLAEHPAMIKRPVLTHGQKTMVGFSAESYTELVSTLTS